MFIDKFLLTKNGKVNGVLSTWEEVTVKELIEDSIKFERVGEEIRRGYCRCKGKEWFEENKWCILCPYNILLAQYKWLSREDWKKENRVEWDRLKHLTLNRRIERVEVASSKYREKEEDYWFLDLCSYKVREGDKVNCEVSKGSFIKFLQKRDYTMVKEEAKVEVEGDRLPYDIYRRVIRSFFRWEDFEGAYPFPLRIYAYLLGNDLREQNVRKQKEWFYSKREPVVKLADLKYKSGPRLRNR